MQNLLDGELQAKETFIPVLMERFNYDCLLPNELITRIIYEVPRESCIKVVALVSYQFYKQSHSIIATCRSLAPLISRMKAYLKPTFDELRPAIYVCSLRANLNFEVKKIQFSGQDFRIAQFKDWVNDLSCEIVNGKTLNFCRAIETFCKGENLIVGKYPSDIRLQSYIANLSRDAKSALPLFKDENVRTPILQAPTANAQRALEPQQERSHINLEDSFLVVDNGRETRWRVWKFPCLKLLCSNEISEDLRWLSSCILR